jgi:hypothetical protein
MVKERSSYNLATLVLHSYFSTPSGYPGGIAAIRFDKLSVWQSTRIEESLFVGMVKEFPFL